MKYSKIEEYFKKDEVGITELLKECEDVFETIDGYKQQFMANLFSTADEYKTALNVFTGLYIFLEPIYNLAQAYKEIKEDEAYCNLRTQAEVEGKKMTADALKVEAHKAVSLWIRTRNIFESYVNTTEKSIITIQSQLNRWEKTRDYKPVDQS
jgi:hypothetical protein